MSSRLSIVLAKNIGRTLTVDLARQMASDANSMPNYRVDPARFNPREWNGYVLACEPLESMNSDLAGERRSYLTERYPQRKQGIQWSRLLRAQREGCHVTFTARKGGQLAGSLWLWLDFDIDNGDLTATDDLFYIEPEHRSTGHLAARLWSYTERAMFEYGVRSAIFHSRSDNGAQRLAQFMGYSQEAVRMVKRHEGDNYEEVPTRHTETEL